MPRRCHRCGPDPDGTQETTQDNPSRYPIWVGICEREASGREADGDRLVEYPAAVECEWPGEAVFRADVWGCPPQRVQGLLGKGGMPGLVMEAGLESVVLSTSVFSLGSLVSVVLSGQNNQEENL